MTTDLYSIATGLQPTNEDVKAAEAFAVQFLQSNFPTMDLRSGTGVRDLVVRPTATLIALLDLALTQYFSQNTLADATDATPQSVVDGILSNWFVTRKTGSTATISARLYFAQAKTVTLPSSTYFSPDNALMFYPAQTYVFTASQLTQDVNSGEYYIDVNLVSQSADPAFNVESGSLLYFSTFDAYFLHAEINYLVTPASAPETNTQFIERSSSAISTRNLINTPSVKSNLTTAFPTLTDIVPVGMGDPEMLRDKAQVDNPNNPGNLITFHLGGNVDIYCRTPLTSTINQYTADANGDVVIVGPVYGVSISSIAGGSTADTIPQGATYTTSYSGYSSPGTITDPTQDVGFSSRQTMTLSFGTQYANETISLKVSYFQLISSIQTYLEDSNNRVLSGSYLARGSNIYLLDFVLTPYGSVAPSSTSVTKTIKAYLDSLESGVPFVMSDLQASLKDSGIGSFKTPLGVTYSLYKRDYTTSTGTITDYLDPQDRTANFRFNSLTIQPDVSI